MGFVDGADGLAEETVGGGEDVGFVGDGELGGGVDGGSAERAEGLALESDFEGDFADAGGGAVGDAFDGFGGLAVDGVVVGAFFLDVLGWWG